MKFEPGWYAERQRDLEPRRTADSNRTWHHPMDWVLAVAFVAVLICFVKGWL